jgi:enoyl-CoA hydratase/carnithine racemase
MRRSLGLFQQSIGSSQIKNLLTLELNRPKVLNAIGLPEVRQLNDILVKINGEETNNDVGAFLIRGYKGSKAFCAGGDVKSIYTELEHMVAVGKQEDIGTGKKGHYHTDFFREEYILNHRMANSIVPQISIWDGIVMGGGVGISIFGDFRIATEKTMFALPETALGIFPDIGCSGWLPHITMDTDSIAEEHGKDLAATIGADDGVGLYIGMTGCRLNASDVLETGIATHLVKSSEVDALESALSNIEMSLAAPDAARKAIRTTLTDFLHVPQPSHKKDAVAVFAPSPIILMAPFIARCFGNNVATVEEIVSRLKAETTADAIGGTAASREWAEKTMHTLSKMSPTALKV